MNSLHSRVSVTPSARLILAILFIILGFHILSIFRDWYITVGWIDIPLHIAGGVWVALAFFYFQRKYVPQFSGHPFWFSYIAVLGFVMLVGVAWEWFEYGFDFFVAKDNFAWRAQLGLPDTMGDLFSDLVGGGIVGLYLLCVRGSSKRI